MRPKDTPNSRRHLIIRSYPKTLLMFSSTIFVKSFLLSLFCALNASAQFVPNPDKAQLVLYNSYGYVWRTEKLLESKYDQSSSVVTFYLQKELSEPALFLFRDTVGMISRFNPIWLDKNETLIAWDVAFSYLKNGAVVMLEIDSQSVPNSLYYPVLCGVSDKGVLVLAQNYQTTSYFNEPAYFVPWSNDNGLVDFTKAVRFTDSEGIPFFSTIVKWQGDVIVSWRPSTLFTYHISTSKLDSFKIQVTAQPGGYDEYSVSQLSFFDGQVVLINHYGEKIAFDLKSKTQSPFSPPPGSFQSIARKDNLIYGIHQSIQADSAEYALMSYDLQEKKTKELLRLEAAEINEEVGVPIFVSKPNVLIVWTHHQWKWIKL